MTDELNMELITPTLSFDNIDESAVKELPAEDAESFRMQQFSPDEIKQINNFAEKIDFHDTNLIISYGSGAQQRLADFSDAALEHVRAKDMDEIGDMLSSLVADLKFDPEEKKGLKGLFNRGANKVEQIKAHYTKVEGNIDSVAAQLRRHQQILIKDITVQDRLYENNKTFFKEITMYIAAGRIALQRAYQEELPALKEKAAATGLAEDAQAVKDFSSMCERFEKKLHDLDLTRMICLQNAPQIRLVQNNAVILSDKINSTLLNTLPLWKNQMIISLGIAHSKEAIRAQKMVTDTTNELLKKNAEMLHQGSVEIAAENERGIVDIETLQHTNEELIATLEDIKKIQEEGRQKRREAETELINIENELKTKLIDMSRNGN